MAQQQSTPKHHQSRDEAENLPLAVQLNISGAEENRQTDAEALGKFITHIAEAARLLGQSVAEDRYEDSRDPSGRPTKKKVKIQPVQLENLTAPAGRVKLTFCAPAPQYRDDLEHGFEQQLPLEDFPQDTIESEALRTIFAAFTKASNSDEFDTEALVDPLATAGVRDAVRKAVAVAQHNRWQLGGIITQAKRENAEFELTNRGQARLIDALKADLIGKYRATLRGTIDGHKNSNNTIYFRPKNSTQSWSTVAATDVIYSDAARISLDIQNLVDLTVEFEPKVDREGNPTERVVRRIVSIDKVLRAETRERLF